MSKQLKQRLLLGGIALVVLLISIYYSEEPYFKPFFIGLNAGFICLAVWEYYRLAEHKGDKPLILLGVISTVVYVVSVYLGQMDPGLHFLSPLILFITLFLSFLSFFNLQPNPLNNIATTLFGIAYLTIPLSFGLKINYYNLQNPSIDGRLWFFYVLLITKMTDTGAYFFGKTMGKTRLVPHISPKKTVEGSLGGLATALVMSIIFYFSASSTHMTFWQSIWLSILMSIFAQFGDLAESVLKRDAGVKDSSDIPGLGGMLDVADSLVFTLPFMYFLLKMHLLS